KWFSLACVVFLFAAFAFINTQSSRDNFTDRAVRCHDIAVSVIHSNGYNIESWRAAKAQFNTCILVQGVNPSRIPAFDDMFPYPLISDDAYGVGQSESEDDIWE
ncbi:MAG: hypothetical protein RI911_55, partial [Candidatus Parcubacteria bacterium]